MKEYALLIAKDDGSMAVGVLRSGAVEFGEDVSPDAAAATFWAAMAALPFFRCAACNARLADPPPPRS